MKSASKKLWKITLKEGPFQLFTQELLILAIREHGISDNVISIERYEAASKKGRK